jgi:hypothetical protein
MKSHYTGIRTYKYMWSGRKAADCFDDIDKVNKCEPNFFKWINSIHA